MLTPEERETLSRLKRELEALREERIRIMQRLTDVEALTKRTRTEVKEDLDRTLVAMKVHVSTHTAEQIKPLSEKLTLLIDMGAAAARKATERKEILEEIRKERTAELGVKILEADLAIKQDVPIQESINGPHRRKMAERTAIIAGLSVVGALLGAALISHFLHL